MFSICIKFKPESNWRPLCRRFDDIDDCKRFIDDAFKKWKVDHCSVFCDGVFMTCYWLSPSLTAALRESAQKLREKRLHLYANFVNH